MNIPDISIATFPAQACPDSTDFQAGALRDLKTATVSGGAVTAQSSPNMTVQCAVGVDTVLGTDATATAAPSVTIAPVSASDRRDIIVFTPGTGYQAIAGTPWSGTGAWVRASTGDPPLKPAIPSGSTLHAEIYVPYNAISIGAGNIIDKREFIADPQGIPFNSFQTATGITLPITTAETLITSPTLQNGLYVVAGLITLQGGASASTVDGWLAMGGGGVASQGLIASTCATVASKPGQIVLPSILEVTTPGALLLKAEAGAVANATATSSQGPANMANATSLSISQLR